MTALALRPLGACLLALLLPRPAPLVAVGPAAVAVGVATGAAVFVALARGRSLVLRSRLGARRRAARAAWLTGVAAWEEALYRGLLLGAVATSAGAAAGLAVSTAAFVLAHRSQGRQAIAHLLTGAAFGVVYLGTGSLLAAIAAHAAYDLLVDAQRLALRTRPLRTVERGRARSYRRRSAMAVETSRTGAPAEAVLSAAAVASLVGVHRRFGHVEALAGVTLAIEPGEVVALLGPNGAGKTTAVSILLGLRRPDAGEAILFGRPPTSSVARLAVGTVLQESAFPPTLRVRDVLDLVRAHFPNPRPRDELLAEFGLAAHARRQVGGLSGGERRRLALAAALAGRPRLLVLDEPTAGVDVEARRAMWERIRGFAAGGGAVLLTTHHLEEAEELATRVVVLARGRIVGEGSPAGLRARAGATRIRFLSPQPPGLAELGAAMTVDGDRVTITTQDPGSVLERLVAAGIALRGLEVTPVSLEQVFLELTGGGS
jgi:ABC-2 type transport system ATP-binding protein